MKRWLAMLLLLLVPCCCACGAVKRYSTTWYDSFDTVITLTGYAQSQQAFNKAAEAAHDEFIRLHNIFDSHSAHDGVVGAYAMNRGESPIDPELQKIIDFCDDLYDQTYRRTDIRMGALIEVWDRYAKSGDSLPTQAELDTAALDRSQIDLGAVGKGYAVERVAEILDELMPAYLIDAGGNVRSGAPPSSGRAWWMIGIQDPRESGVRLRLAVTNLSVVSSGDYERYFEVDGTRYHHIIDPDTKRPGGDIAQVTVLTKDSALADYLSTVLFLLPYEKGRALVEGMQGVDAIWVTDSGIANMTEGAKLRMTDGA